MMRKLALALLLLTPSLYAQSYSTNFPATETPVSEGGNWINGGPAPGTGLAWGNVNTTTNLAFGTTVSGAPPYTDSTAVLTGSWLSNQAACGVVFIDPTLNRFGNFEVEIRLRTTITANSITGYEATYSTQSGGGQYAGFARWNGPLNSFTSIGTLNHSVPALTSGDSVCASIVGSNLTIWMIHAGVVTVANTGSDSTYTGGSPGMGFWDFGGSVAIDKLYGFSSFQAGNVAAQTCNSSDVQTALNGVGADGTTVLIPAGTCAWGTVTGPQVPAVTYNQAFSSTILGSSVIACSGTPGTAGYTCTDNGGTTIIDHVNHNGADPSDLVINTAAGKSFRMLGLTFAQDSASVVSFHGAALQVNGASQAVRVDHVHFSHLDSLAFSTNGTWSGVFDHIIGEGTSGSGWRDHASGFGDADWADTTSFGAQTGHGWRYYESSIMHSFSNDGIDGGRMVYRFNTETAICYQTLTQGLRCATEPLQTHATGSAFEGRAMRAFEVYGNYFNSPNYLSDTGMEMTSSPGLLWGNTFVPTSFPGGCTTAPCGWTSAWRTVENRYQGTPYPQTVPPGGWGYCGTNFNGTGSAWDFTATGSGYPCLDQVGRGQSDLLSGSFPNRCDSTTGCSTFNGTWPNQALEPVYEWLDTWTPPNNFTNTGFWGNQATAVIQTNRDYYLWCGAGSPTGCTSFNGTVGVGTGTLAARPATCTTGVGYFATDQGNWNQSGNGFGNGLLYKCTSTNTWTLIYTPGCYPHPLITGGSCAVVGTPAVTLAPTSVAFGNVNVGSTSPSTTVKLTNSGTGTLTFSGSGISLAGTNPSDFAQSNNCGTAVLASGSCNIVVTCTPASAASFSATVSITDNASGSPQTVPLTCTGVTATAGITFAPTSVTFPAQSVGTSSSPTVVRLTNTGSGNLTVTNIAVAGGNSTSFSQTNNCLGTLVPAQFCNINVTFSPKVAGALASTVCVTDNAPASPQCFNISGTGTGVAGIAFAPTNLSFGNQTVSGTSAALSVTVSNPGTGPTTLSSVALTGTNAADFAISANSCPGSLAVGATCVVSVTFTPAASGSRSANLTFTDTAAGSPQNVALTGTGTQAGIGFTPTSLAFGNQNVGTLSAPLSTTVTNTGTATLNIANISIVGTSDFSISSTNCGGAALAPAGTCSISVTFKPSASGPGSANLSFADNAPGSPQTVPLTGTGLAVALGVSPSSLTFPATVVGQSSAAQPVTLSVSGGGAQVTITSIVVSGGNSGDFPIVNGCTGTVNPGSSCTVNVTFMPAATGARSSSLTVTSSAPNSPQTVTLSGTGTQSGAQLSPTSVAFPNTPVGTTSSPVNVTLTNNGTATLNITSILLGGTNPSYFAISSNTCGTTLAAGASCIVSLTFTPQTAISASGTLTFTDDGPNSPQVVTLSGLGTFLALSFSPASLTFPNTALSSTSPSQTFTITNNGNGIANLTSIVLGGTNPGDFTESNNCGTTLAGGASCMVTDAFKPTAIGSRVANVTITSNAPGSPATVSLQGAGFTPTPAVSLSTASIAFGNQTISTQSNPQVVILTNTGTATLTVNAATKTGSNPGDFGVTTTCGGTLAVNASCTYSLTFTPTAGGSRSATLNVNTNAASSPDLVTLAGTGVSSPNGAPAPQVFGN